MKKIFTVLMILLAGGVTCAFADVIKAEPNDDNNRFYYFTEWDSDNSLFFVGADNVGHDLQVQSLLDGGWKYATTFTLGDLYKDPGLEDFIKVFDYYFNDEDVKYVVNIKKRDELTFATIIFVDDYSDNLIAVMLKKED